MIGGSDGAVLVRGGAVVTPDGVVDGGAVVADGTTITAVVGPAGVPAGHPGWCVDAADGWVVPGLIDLQVNGGDGIDLTTDPSRMIELGRRLVAQGVTAFLPTIVTAPAGRRAAALAAWTERRVPPGAAVPLGLHLEGPMLAPARRGAHAAAHLHDLTVDDVAGWSPDAGVAMVTLAPERPGAIDVARRLADTGVVVAIGHTDGRADDVHRAVAAGARYVTHLFNAMRPFGHRDPGPIGATLGGEGLVAGLICDRVHVADDAVRMAWRALGPERTNLVTDAVAARGGDGGRSCLGGVELSADGAGAVRTAGGVLAGSVLTLDVAVRNLVTITGCAVAAAIATVTATPAAVLGCRDRGVLRPGARADITVLDADLKVRTVLIGGVVAHDAAAGL